MTATILRRTPRRSAMRKVRTISVSLEPEYVEILEKLAKEEGSKSAALRKLLWDHRQKEWEDAYREYYSDPKNVAADIALTREMLSIASWPDEDEDEKPTSRRPKGRSSR
jgi:hypothetical protein